MNESPGVGSWLVLIGVIALILFGMSFLEGSIRLIILIVILVFSIIGVLGNYK